MTFIQAGAKIQADTHLNLLGDPPACRLTRLTSQSISDATVTAVNFTSERFDTDGMHDTATNNTRITFTTAGLYLVGFHGLFAASNDYARVFPIIRKNGATELARGSQVETTTNVQPQMEVSTVHKFAAGDYVEALVFQDNTAGVSRNLEQTDDRSPEFWAVRMGSGD